MKNTVHRYLERRGCQEQWPLVAAERDGVERVVVIPVLAEQDHLFDTLDSLARNDTDLLRSTLVICVVNNRALPHTPAAMLHENQATLDRLRNRDEEAPSWRRLRLAYVDASSPGREFPPKDGVGLARKIGMDWGVAMLEEAGVRNGILLSLDADTHVEPHYLTAIQRHFQEPKTWAAVVDYAHRIEGGREEQRAVVCYELFLRYHVLGLAYAGSPYAFPTIGSTMLCRAEAYVAVSGMNRRQGGEDFYFLQQLAKTGRVDRIADTTVHPSPRPSQRVPFGTGPRVRRFLANPEAEYRLYHPDSYRVVRDWLRLIAKRADEEPGPILTEAEEIHPALRGFLEEAKFESVWGRLRQGNPRREARLAQFHRWFDALRTVRLIHHLRDHGLPDEDMFSAMSMLLAHTHHPASTSDWEGIHDDLEAQKALLGHLRQPMA